MATNISTLYLTLSEPQAEEERIEKLTISLMNDLRDMDLISVERPLAEEPPEGVKGEPFTIGALALVALPTVLPNLVNFLQAWTMRAENRKVKIKTPAGLEVEFTPEKILSADELVNLAEKLAKAQA